MIALSDPAISVLMGVFYQRDDLSLLQRSVDSILAQTFEDFEFLICDDGSKPAASQVLDEYEVKDTRIHLIRSGKAFGLPEKLNLCLKEAKGECIARMDDDDYSHPDRFQKQLQALNDHPEVSFVGCNVTLCSEDRIVGHKSFPLFPSIKDFYITQPFIHPTLIFRRKVLENVNGYSEDAFCDHCEDYDLLLRLYEKGYQGMNLQEVLFDYTAPSVKGNRTMKHRWYECVTRARRFKSLGVLGSAFPYVIKPLVVGIIPNSVLSHIKRTRKNSQHE